MIVVCFCGNEYDVDQLSVCTNPRCEDYGFPFRVDGRDPTEADERFAAALLAVQSAFVKD